MKIASDTHTANLRPSEKKKWCRELLQLSVLQTHFPPYQPLFRPVISSELRSIIEPPVPTMFNCPSNTSKISHLPSLHHTPLVICLFSLGYYGLLHSGFVLLFYLFVCLSWNNSLLCLWIGCVLKFYWTFTAVFRILFLLISTMENTSKCNIN